ncbi:MAG: exonuclease domain-containing protein [Candidatus Acidiferrales bacterium]
MTLAAWCAGPLLAFDTETTSPDPETARLVTASAILVSSSGVLERRQWLVNPGVEIPAEAVAIHGITTEHARAKGVAAAVAVPEVAAVMSRGWDRGAPLVAMNARYDIGVFLAEVARLGLRAPAIGPVLDPLVLDRAVDKYRRGSRKLVDLAHHYGVQLEGAHSSDGDALAAARVVWRMATTAPALRGLTLAEMQAFQERAHADWATGFQQHLRRNGKADAVIDTAWPCPGGAERRPT